MYTKQKDINIRERTKNAQESFLLAGQIAITNLCNSV